MKDEHAGKVATTDDPTSSTTALMGVVGALAVFVICVALQALYLWSVDREHRRKVIERAPVELRAVRVEQAETLGAYRWIDREKGIVSIPIERAMELVVEEYNGGRTGGSN